MTSCVVQSSGTGPVYQIVLICLASISLLLAACEKSPYARRVVEEGAADALKIVYAGSSACASCHVEQYRVWNGSQHHLAMQAADESTVLGDFAGIKVAHAGITSSFFRRDGRYFVRTDGPDGEMQDFAIAYTFGTYPLQQYLVGFSDGRFQPLPLAWDSRHAENGGQRWFHLNPGERIDHRDPLHWTRWGQNWNRQCASCHTTNLRKNYDAATDRYATTFSEIGVGCEACHGPGSRHVGLARSGRISANETGLAVHFKRRRIDDWKFAAAGQRIASTRRSPNPALIDVCATCHTRRSALREDGQLGEPLHDSYQPALPVPPLYHVDGQQREEAFTWGSFLQSKMHARGVDCSDCHEPHSLRLRAEGNALCGGCHRPSVYDTSAHERHAPGTAGSRCVDCHMPPTTYMIIDARRDHSFSIPRPDLSLSVGIPNACTGCHSDRKASWSAAAIDRWYGRKWRDRSSTAPLFHAASTLPSKAAPGLLALAADTGTPAILRAAALTMVGKSVSLEIAAVTDRHLKDGSSLVRAAAAGLLEGAAQNVRLHALAPLLSDPVLGVRAEAARLLADVPDDLLGSMRVARQKAASEYIAAQRLDMDQPHANVNLGNYLAQSGHVEQAHEAYQQAIKREPRFAAAYLNLADLYRAQSRDDLGEAVLHQGLAEVPDSADLRHGLGLLLARERRYSESLLELQQAAIDLLERAARQFADDRDILSALVAFHQEAGHHATARRLADQLERLDAK